MSTDTEEDADNQHRFLSGGKGSENNQVYKENPPGAPNSPGPPNPLASPDPPGPPNPHIEPDKRRK